MSANWAKYYLKFYFSNLQNYQTVTKQNKDSEKYRNLKKQKLREEVQKQERNLNSLVCWVAKISEYQVFT